MNGAKEQDEAVAIVDAGSTNTKVLLFGPDGSIVEMRKTPSRHRSDGPYLSIDLEPAIAFAAETLRAFDAVLPIGTIVPVAHGSSLTLLDESGAPALPIMMYEADPPQRIINEYAEIEPPFAEVFAPTNPQALTLGRQLHWQETAFPDAFAQVKTIVPTGQYLAHRLGGRLVSEITALGAQTHLWDVKANRFSSIARTCGWDRLFAPFAGAWEEIGSLRSDLRGDGFRGRAAILAGIHDSSANFLRYLAAGLKPLTLLSTGTWIIGFDTETDVADLDPVRDTASNTSIFGEPIACMRFMGGREFALVAEGASGDAASLDLTANLIGRGTLALPSFTDSGGPLPETGGQGRIVGPIPENASERASLASLYCAQMTSLSLDAVGSSGTIVIDGPFSENPVYAAVLACLRAPQPVVISTFAEGTAAGAAVLAAMTGPTLPRVEIELQTVNAPEIPGLATYHADWQAQAVAG